MSAWLLAAADRLDAEGQHALAAEARAEAAMPAPAPRTPVTARCDACGAKVTGKVRLAAFALVDWVLCKRCSA